MDLSKVLYVDGDGLAGDNDTQKLLRMVRNTPNAERRAGLRQDCPRRYLPASSRHRAMHV